MNDSIFKPSKLSLTSIEIINSINLKVSAGLLNHIYLSQIKNLNLSNNQFSDYAINLIKKFILIPSKNNILALNFDNCNLNTSKVNKLFDNNPN